MKSNELLTKIDEIAATPSKNEKQAMVTNLMAFPLFERVCQYAYNPFKTYGLRKLPIGKAHPGYKDGFDDKTWDILDCLIDRRLTGSNAMAVVESEIDALDEQSAELLRRIIRKNLRAGFSESTINKARKGLIPEFAYMRCSLPKDVKFDKWPWADGVFSQEKADGMFANVDVELDGNVSVRSRQGTEFPMEAFADFVEEAKVRLIRGNQHHGEFLVERDGAILPRAEGNGVMNHVLSGGSFAPNERPIYKVWDSVPLTHVKPGGSYDTSYKSRLAQVVVALRRDRGKGSIDLIPTRVVRSLAEAKIHAAELMKLGKEGTVVKHPEGPWVDSTSKYQVKVKLEFVVDLEVVAVVPGSAGTKNEGRAGSLTVKTSDDLLVTDVAVKNEAMRNSVDANPDEWIGKIIAVVANDIIEPSPSNDLHSLSHPRMAEAGYRADKSVADSLQRVFDQKQAAIYGESILAEVAA